MPTLHVNEADLDALIRSRESLLYGSLDAKRPQAWRQYGYVQNPTFEHFYAAYDRQGAGYGAVHKLLDKCWQEWPRIKSPEKDEATPWEEKVNQLLDDIDGWAKLCDCDRRNMVGRYAAIVYIVADGKQLPEELGRGELKDIKPLWESQIKPLKFEEDITSPNYGKVLMYQVETERPTGDNDHARPRTWVKVHPSRVQMLAEGASGDDFLGGRSLLKPGFNALCDLEKVHGGGAENALKNSSRTLAIKFDAAASPQVLTQNANGTPSGKTVREVIEERTRALNSNIDSSITLQGGEASTLQTEVGDLSSPFEISASVFAASVQIPLTVLFGQQTGRLASDEDQKDWNARARSRQVKLLSRFIKQFVTRMQACGAIDEGKFVIEWPPLDAPTDTQRLDNASKMAAINKANADAGQAAVFDGNEIRKAVGYEERDELEDIPLEGEPEDEDPGAGGAPAAPAPAPRASLRAAA